MELPHSISHILSIFSGYTTYIYGRSVREILMGFTPHYCRIITTAPPSVLRRMFPRTGMMHGKLRTVIDGVDCTIIPSHSEPAEVCASQDFTIDASAYSEITGLLDNHRAVSDIRSKTIRFNICDEAAIHVNPLIMLKAVRLCAELNFTLDTDSSELIKKCAPLIRRISTRSVAYEIDKILMSPNPCCMRMLHELRLMKYIIPQLDICFGEQQRNKYHIYDVGEHIMHAVQSTPRDYVLRWAALLHDVGKPCCSSTDNNGIIHFYGHHHESKIIADDILHRYGIDRDAAHDILILIENHDVRVDPNPCSVKKMMCRTGELLFEKLMQLQTADNMAKNPKYFAEKYKRIDAALKLREQILANGEPYQYSQLKVNSRDLQKRGIRPGRETNDIMRALMDEVIGAPELNSREYLLKRALELKNK